MNPRNLLSPRPHRPPVDGQKTDSCEDGCFFCTGPETD
jgi:hypothetical protein